MPLLKTALCWNGSLLVVEWMMFANGMIGFSRMQMVDNVPFATPVTVAAVDETSITLTDGRKLLPSLGVDDWLRQQIRESRGVLGIERDPDQPNRVTISVRRPRFLCGLGQPIVVLPLFTRNSPRYVPREAAWGEIRSAGP